MHYSWCNNCGAYCRTITVESRRLSFLYFQDLLTLQLSSGNAKDSMYYAVESQNTTFFRICVLCSFPYRMLILACWNIEPDARWARNSCGLRWWSGFRSAVTDSGFWRVYFSFRLVECWTPLLRFSELHIFIIAIPFLDRCTTVIMYK